MCEVTDHEGGGRELTLRDKLAIDRTALANERTLLAYARTGLALMIVGGSLVKFFESPAASLAGRLLLAASALVILIGAARFLSVQRRLKGIAMRTTTRCGARQAAQCAGTEPARDD